MNKTEIWKNFNLGEELSIAGVFIYNGLRRFHDMRGLDHTDEIFEMFYHLAVGLERILKIAVVFVEHEPRQDQGEFEKSLYTHSHTALLTRVNTKHDLGLAHEHLAVLALLETFYSDFRYGRFSMSTAYDPGKEQAALFRLLNKQLGTELRRDGSLFIKENDIRYKKHLTTLILKIARSLYDLIRDKAHEMNIYTYELRYDSKASSVFQRDPKTLFLLEDVAWKELLIFLMNSDVQTGTLDFLRGIDPLDIDPAMIPEYLETYCSRRPVGSLIDEVDELYNDIDDKGERLRTMLMVGNPAIDLDGASG